MRFIDFFAGIGGFRLGMEMAGHECVGHCEIDNSADKSYRAMHIPKESEWFAKDITTVKYGDLPKAECYCFGFPCQSFSVAGSRRGFADTRGTLFFEVMRIAKERKPEYLFAENVAGLLSHDGGRTFGTILATLGELGYWWEYQVLNSKNFGVPQNRERVFIIGHLGGRGGREIFPLGENDKKINTEYKQTKQIAIKQINHLDDWQGSTRQIDRVYSPKGLCPTLDAMGGGNRMPKIAIPVLTPDRLEKRQNGRRFKTDGEPMFTLTAQDRHGIMLTRHEIKSKTDISHCLMARDYKGIGNQEMTAVLEIKEATKQGYAIAEPGDRSCNQATIDNLRIRKLTPKECWRLQGYPDEYFERAKAAGVSDSQLYKQAGNSVTVNVIHEIAKRLKESGG